MEEKTRSKTSSSQEETGSQPGACPATRGSPKASQTRSAGPAERSVKLVVITFSNVEWNISV